jgi:CheY-like chemotaxis protein
MASLGADAVTCRVASLEAGEVPPRVLVAEDHDENRALLVTLLRGVGFDVRDATNGREAVDLFEAWQPHFIWMDIRMPVMDGLEATRRIKATDAGSKTVIAALTAHALEEERDMILKAGCDAFVRKPYREHEIFDVMAGHLGVSYLYEEGMNPVQRQPGITPAHLAATLSPDLRDRLRQAVLRLNRTLVQEVVVEIKELDASIGAALGSFADSLDFEGLLALLETPETASEDAP